MVDLARLNYGILALLPKFQDANMINMYKPICMTNVIFKLIPKVLHNMIIVLFHMIVAPTYIKDSLPVNSILSCVSGPSGSDLNDQ